MDRIRTLAFRGGGGWFITEFWTDGIIRAPVHVVVESQSRGAGLAYLAATQRTENPRTIRNRAVLQRDTAGEMPALGEVPSSVTTAPIDGTTTFHLLAWCTHAYGGPLVRESYLANVGARWPGSIIMATSMRRLRGILLAGRNSVSSSRLKTLTMRFSPDGSPLKDHCALWRRARLRLRCQGGGGPNWLSSFAECTGARFVEAAKTLSLRFSTRPSGVHNFPHNALALDGRKHPAR